MRIYCPHAASEVFGLGFWVGIQGMDFIYSERNPISLRISPENPASGGGQGWSAEQLVSIPLDLTLTSLQVLPLFIYQVSAN